MSRFALILRQPAAPRGIIEAPPCMAVSAVRKG
jgi:hypothetical protein